MQRCRKFKLIDAMILIAAAAGWMAMSRGSWSYLHEVWIARRNGIPLYVYAGIVNAVLIRAVMMLAVAYVAIRLLPPRLPESDLICQPGMLSLGFLAGLFFLYTVLAQLGLLGAAWTDLSTTIALGLSWSAACWFYRSRAQPGWIEGLGRSFGVSLVVYTANHYTMSLLN